MSQSVTSNAWQVLRGHPYLFAFPILSGILSSVFSLVVVAGFVLFAMRSPADERLITSAADHPTSSASGWTLIVVAAVVAFLCTLIHVFLMGAMTSCADEELQGRGSSIGAGVGAAGRRLPALMGWAVIQTVVGYILRLIQGAGSDNVIVMILRFVLAFLVAVVWGTLTLFVLPLIMLRGKGPIQAMKESVRLVTTTWGSKSRRGFRIGSRFWGLMILAGFVLGIVVILLSAYAEKLGAWSFVVIALVVIASIVYSIILSAMYTVFGVALLHYVEDGEVVGPFDVQEMQHAVVSR